MAEIHVTIVDAGPILLQSMVLCIYLSHFEEGDLVKITLNLHILLMVKASSDHSLAFQLGFVDS